MYIIHDQYTHRPHVYNITSTNITRERDWLRSAGKAALQLL